MDRLHAVVLVTRELSDLTSGEPAFKSIDEGIKAISLQYMELEAEIDTPDPDGPGEGLRNEAVKLAASALRFLIDLC